jgi:hypothetical protein
MEKKPQLTFSKKELLTKSFKISSSNNKKDNTNYILNKNNKKKESKTINIDLNNKKNIPQKINPRKEPMKFLHNCFMGAGINFLNPNNISNISDNDSVNMSFYNNPTNNEIINNNLSNNLNSNLERQVFGYVMNILQNNIFNNENNLKHLMLIKKIQKIQLNEKYCNKNNEGILELPNCCICINDIQLKENCIILPCKHILHWKCALEWLKNNNICPICRSELFHKYK